MAFVNKKPFFESETQTETKKEEAFATGKYQTSQLENGIEQTGLLKEQLTIQKKILERIEECPCEPTSNGDGIDSVLDAAGDAIPAKKSEKLKKIGKFLSKNKARLLKGAAGIAGGLSLESGGEALKEEGYTTAGDLVSTAGSAVEGATIGATAGSAFGPAGTAIGAGAGAIMGAAQGFSDSFGEGGFDLIQKLRKEDAISYPTFGTTPTVEKWDVIEKLPLDQIKTLIDTNEFEGRDLQQLEKLLGLPEKSNRVFIPEDSTGIVTPEKSNSDIGPIKAPPQEVITKEGVSINQKGWDVKQQAIPETPEEKVITKEGVSINQKGWDVKPNNISEFPKAIVPSVVTPTIGNHVYEESFNNSNLKNKSNKDAQIINAPTSVTNNTNNTKNSIIKLPARNTDLSIVEYFKSRYS